MPEIKHTVNILRALECVFMCYVNDYETHARKVYAAYVLNQDMRPLVEGYGMPHVVRDSICTLLYVQ